MNIVLCFDDQYCPYAATTIVSVCRNNKVAHIFAIVDKIRKKNGEKITYLCDEYNVPIDFIQIDTDRMRNFPIGKGTINPGLTLAAYNRLYIPELLPQNVDKVIYLDCDLVVDGDLTGLWNMKVTEDICIVALEDKQDVALSSIRRLGLKRNQYFNSGVLLMMLNNLRKMRFTNKAETFIRENRDIIQFHDQDVLNALLCEHCEFFPMKYNLLEAFLIKEAQFERYANSKADLYKPAVIHYAGGFKPWHKECRNPYRYLFYKYLSFTPWEDIKPVRKLNTPMKRIKYKLRHYYHLAQDILRNHRFHIVESFIDINKSY